MSANPSLSAEARVLLLSAGGPENDAALRALLRRGVLWPRLGRLAARENALAVLMRRLDAAAPGALPPEVRAEWQPLARVAEFRLAWLDERLSRTLAALAAEGIGGVLLKGAALARTVYPRFTDRPMGDLDLLVPAGDAERAHRLLRAEGWKPEEGDGAGYDGHHHLAPLVDARGTGVALEIHTALFPDGHPFALSADDIRAEAGDAGGRGGAVPSTRHLALHLCLHFAWSHQAEAGAWRTFRDLHALAPTLDWAAFARAALDSRGASACYWTLRLAGAASGLAVPDAVMAALRPPVREGTMRLLERHFLAQLLPSARACPSVRLRRAAWERAMQPAHSGHGVARPWLLDRAPAEAPAAAPLGLVARNARALGRWGRYAGALLGRPGRAPADPPVGEGEIPLFTASGASTGSRLLPPGFRRARLGSTPTVSIVMASMRGGDALRDALRDLVPHCREREAELVVALAAEWDGADALRAEYPPARFVVSAGARSAGELRAAGMAEASGDIIALTDEAGGLPHAWLTVAAPVEA